MAPSGNLPPCVYVLVAASLGAEALWREAEVPSGSQVSWSDTLGSINPPSDRKSGDAWPGASRLPSLHSRLDWFLPQRPPASHLCV